MLNSHDFQPKLFENNGPWVIIKWLTSWELVKHLHRESPVTQPVSNKSRNLCCPPRVTWNHRGWQDPSLKMKLYCPDSMRPLVPVTRQSMLLKKTKQDGQASSVIERYDMSVQNQLFDHQQSFNASTAQTQIILLMKQPFTSLYL